MSKIPEKMAFITLKKVDQNVEMPKSTIVLMAYNQERFVEEALASVLSQSYQPLEIIVSDDCSSDNTFAIMKRLCDEYDGPHSVILNRTKENAGIGAHLNELVGLASGELILAAAGDDISRSDRVQKTVDTYLNSNKQYKVFFSDVCLIDETSQETGYLSKSVPNDLLEYISGDHFVLGCSQAFSAELFELFGPLRDGVVNEDQVIPVRGILCGGIGRIALPLVNYRVCESHWKIGDGSKDMVQKIRWKNGICRITAFQQNLVDLKNSGLQGQGHKRISAAIELTETKLKENRAFVRLFDHGLCSLFWRRSFGFAELKASRRYFRWTIRNRGFRAFLTRRFWVA